MSNRTYKQYKMFGTEVEFKSGGEEQEQEPCSGDAGGPLMYQDPDSDRWVIIGKLEFKIQKTYKDKTKKNYKKFLNYKL